MSKTCFLLGGDERQRWAAQALLDTGLEVRCCGVPGMPEALPAPADFVILPFPALQGERLRGTAAPERTAGHIAVPAAPRPGPPAPVASLAFAAPPRPPGWRYWQSAPYVTSRAISVSPVFSFFQSIGGPRSSKVRPFQAIRMSPVMPSLLRM